MKIIEGHKFGFWLVLKPTTEKRYHWDCLCTGCGKAIRSIRKYDLVHERTKSCGCKLIETMKQTNLKKYNAEFVQQNKQIQQKSIKTLQEKYSVDNYAQTEDYKLKVKQTNLEKRGVEHHTQTESWKQQHSKKLKKKKVYGQILLGKSTY